MTFRFEIAPLGEALRVTRVVVGGVGGLLSIERRLRAGMEVAEILPDPPLEP